MFAGKAKQVVIDLDDSSDDDHEYGTPLTGSQIGEDLRLGADEDGDGHRIPFTFLDERDFEPHMDYFLPDVAPEPVDAESACLNRVLEVFPDIDHEHVRQLYQARPVVAEEARPSGDPSGELIVKILDAGDYPKEKDRRKELKRKRAASAGSSQGETAAWEAADRERGSTQYSEEA